MFIQIGIDTVLNKKVENVKKFKSHSNNYILHNLRVLSTTSKTIRSVSIFSVSRMLIEFFTYVSTVAVEFGFYFPSYQTFHLLLLKLQTSVTNLAS